MDVQDAVEEYLGAKRNSVTAKTHRWYNYHLDRFGAWCSTNHLTDLSRLTIALVQSAISTYPTTNGYGRHGYAQVVKGFLNWCASDEYFGVRERMVKRIELPKIEVSEVTLFDVEEIEKLFRACRRMPYPYRAEALVCVLLDTGVRAAELCWDGSRPDEDTGLKVEHVYLGMDGDSYIRVMGKGRKSRTVGLGERSTNALRRYLKRERGHSDCLMCS